MVKQAESRISMSSSPKSGRQEIRVASILVSAKIADDLPIRQLAGEKFLGTNPDSRLKNLMGIRVGPKGQYVSLFRNGTVSIRGCRSLQEAKRILARVVRELKRHATIYETEPKLNVQNVVVSADLKRRLDLGKVMASFPAEDISFEPEQFPGLVWRANNENVVLLLFASGRVVIVGARAFVRARRVLQQLGERLTEAGV